MPNATLQRSIGYQTLADLKELGVDTTDREATLEKLKELSGVDHAARMTHLEQKVKSDVTWVNKGNIPRSMHFCISQAEELKRGMSLDEFTEKMFCRAFLSKLPKEFLYGTAEELG